MYLEQKNKLFIATFFKNADFIFNNLSNKLFFAAETHLRIIPAEKIHITWKFIGDIDIYENEKIFNIVKKYSQIIKDCSINFDKLEVWPNLKYPRLLTITPSVFDEKFTEYFNNLEEALYKSIKLKKEKRRFIPHITVARMKTKKNIDLLKKFDFDPIKLDIKQTSVAQSIYSNNGVLYKQLYNQNL